MFCQDRRESRTLIFSFPSSSSKHGGPFGLTVSASWRQFRERPTELNYHLWHCCCIESWNQYLLLARLFSFLPESIPIRVVFQRPRQRPRFFYNLVFLQSIFHSGYWSPGRENLSPIGTLLTASAPLLPSIKDPFFGLLERGASYTAGALIV